MYTLAPIADLIAAFEDAGIRASDDPGSLQAPAVWVQPVGVAAATLDGTAVNVRLVMVVPDNGTTRAYGALVDLVNQVNAVVPIRAADTRSVLMPDGTYLPGMEANIALHAPITT